MSGRDVVREIPVVLPDSERQHDVLATLWARTRIDDLMAQDLEGIQTGHARPDIRETITQLGLEYRLMTQFTSFVAVEEMTITDSGQPRRVEVPVEMPEGVSRRGVFGEDEVVALNSPAPSPLAMTGNVSGGLVGRGDRSRAGGGGSAGKPVMARRKAREATANRSVVTADAISESRDGDSGPARLSAKERKQQELLSKLHPTIAAVVERLSKKIAQPGAEEAKFVRDGKAEVQIWLADKSPETIAQLKKLGFEVLLDPTTSKMLIGRVSVEKLAALAEIKAVRYIAPQTQG
jgi:Ca-activated chloride channel family protein